MEELDPEDAAELLEALTDAQEALGVESDARLGTLRRRLAEAAEGAETDDGDGDPE